MSDPTDAERLMPKRIQRRRTRGWKMPEGAVYVGRPSKWGNPFHVGDGLTRHDAVLLFQYLMSGRIAPTQVPAEEQKRVGRYIDAHLDELRGKDLACWCPLGVACHADILLLIANTW
ncbi:MAG: DUF4326 domain-containing protein [Candidatus Acidiferrales bacterium]